jgi:hypothetical protein
MRRGGAGSKRRQHGRQLYGDDRLGRRGVEDEAIDRRKVAGRGGIAHYQHLRVKVPMQKVSVCVNVMFGAHVGRHRQATEARPHP